MKKSLFILLSIFTVFMSCSDPCDDVDCGANGTCDDGTCLCEDGYEGTSCETEIRAKYLGTYSGDISPCFEDLGGGLPIPIEIPDLVLEVTADPNDIHNVIIGLDNELVGQETFTVDPTDGSFILPANTTEVEIPDFPLPLVISVSGSGEFIDADNLTFNFSIIISVFGTIDCTITMSK